MTIWQRLDELNMSRYQLSKACGLPWAAVSDICRGKLPLSQCDDEMIDRLANSLQLPTQALLDLETALLPFVLMEPAPAISPIAD